MPRHRCTHEPLSLRAVLLVLGTLLALTFLAPGSARADDYPMPTDGAGTVSSPTVRVGDCVIFSGSGFKPHTRITITDNDRPAGTTHADAQGNFSKKICFSTHDSIGPHRLVARGLGANGAARTVTAVVIVLGAETLSGQTQNAAQGGSGAGHGTGGGSAGSLPFTGADIARLAVVGSALFFTGVLLTLRGRRRQARRRLARGNA